MLGRKENLVALRIEKAVVFANVMIKVEQFGKAGCKRIGLLIGNAEGDWVMIQLSCIELYRDWLELSMDLLQFRIVICYDKGNISDLRSIKKSEDNRNGE